MYLIDNLGLNLMFRYLLKTLLGGLDSLLFRYLSGTEIGFELPKKNEYATKLNKSTMYEVIIKTVSETLENAPTLTLSHSVTTYRSEIYHKATNQIIQ